MSSAEDSVVGGASYAVSSEMAVRDNTATSITGSGLTDSIVIKSEPVDWTIKQEHDHIDTTTAITSSREGAECELIGMLRSEIRLCRKDLDSAQTRLLNADRLLQKTEMNEKYLRNQIRKLRQRLSEDRDIPMPSLVDAGTQVDISPPNPAVQPSSSNEVTNGSGPNEEQSVPVENLAESLKQAAEEATNNSGMVYDQSTGMYYDHNTGYYYNQETSMYFDPTSQSFYYYDESGQFAFHSQIETTNNYGNKDLPSQSHGNHSSSSTHHRRGIHSEHRGHSKKTCQNSLHSGYPSDQPSGTSYHSQTTSEKPKRERHKKDSHEKQRKEKKKKRRHLEDNDQDDSRKHRPHKLKHKHHHKRRKEESTCAQNKNSCDMSESDRAEKNEPCGDLLQVNSYCDPGLNISPVDTLSIDTVSIPLRHDKSDIEIADPNNQDCSITVDNEQTLTHIQVTESNESPIDGEDNSNKTEGQDSDKMETDVPKNNFSSETDIKLTEHLEDGECSYSSSDSESDSDWESGEISDSSSSSSIMSCDQEVAMETDSHGDYTTNDIPLSGYAGECIEVSALYHPPCIRAIVKESDNLPTGSLHIIPYTGGSIGRENSLKQTIIIEDVNVSKTHVCLEYDKEKRQYYVKDFGSQNGTFINDQRLSETRVESDLTPIVHGNVLRVASHSFLIHIHPGTETCDDCEPGQVLAKLKQDANKDVHVVLSKVDKQKLQRMTLKTIKKKFGLQNMLYENNSEAINNPKYMDMADQRRKLVGSDLPFERNEAPASVSKPITEENKGHKMLSKMGWTEGESLGKDNSGITEPVSAILRVNSSAGLGAGYGNNVSLDNAHVVSKNKKWVQAQMRFKETETTRLEQDSSQAENVKEAAVHDVKKMSFIQGDTQRDVT